MQESIKGFTQFFSLIDFWPQGGSRTQKQAARHTFNVLFKVVMANMLVKNCLLTHSADTEQHQHSLSSCLCPPDKC